MVALRQAWSAALAGLGLVVGFSASSQTLRGSLEARTDILPRSALYPDQAQGAAQPASISRVQGATALDPMTDFVLSGRGVLTPSAQQRAFGDLGQAYVERRFGAVAVRVGVLDERWGVLDAWNPANVFNQLDLVDDYRGGTRLGQPGVSLKYVRDSMSFTLLGSTLARERRLGDGRDRFRIAPLPIEQSHFEDGRFAPTVAARAAYRNSGVEIALSHFHGLSREPELSVVLNGNRPVLRADYRIIDQTSIDGQYVLGDYVLRGEAIHRSGQTGRAFFGVGLGIERILYGAFGGAEDLQAFVEYYRDDRPGTAPVTAFQNDVSIGGRLMLNNPGSTEVAARVTLDVVHASKLVEASVRHRIWSDYVLGFDLTAPLAVRGDPALGGFRRDTRLRFSLTRFF